MPPLPAYYVLNEKEGENQSCELTLVLQVWDHVVKGERMKIFHSFDKDRESVHLPSRD